MSIVNNNFRIPNNLNGLGMSTILSYSEMPCRNIAFDLLYKASAIVAGISSPIFYGAGIIAGTTYKCAHHVYNKKVNNMIGHSLLRKVNNNRFNVGLASAAAYVMNRFISTEQFASVLGKINLATYAPTATKACAFGAKYLPAVVGFNVGVSIVFPKLNTAYLYMAKVSEVHQHLKDQAHTQTVLPANSPRHEVVINASWLNAMLEVYNEGLK